MDTTKRPKSNAAGSVLKVDGSRKLIARAHSRPSGIERVVASANPTYGLWLYLCILRVRDICIFEI